MFKEGPKWYLRYFFLYGVLQNIQLMIYVFLFFFFILSLVVIMFVNALLATEARTVRHRYVIQKTHAGVGDNVSMGQKELHVDVCWAMQGLYVRLVSNPCRHGGQCINGPEGITCRCMLGYAGPVCETGKYPMQLWGTIYRWTRRNYM